jgi:hypothetical protein
MAADQHVHRRQEGSGQGSAEARERVPVWLTFTTLTYPVGCPLADFSTLLACSLVLARDGCPG